MSSCKFYHDCILALIKCPKKKSLLADKQTQISLTLVLFKFPDVQSHGRQTSIDPVFTPESLGPGQSSHAILLLPISFDGLNPVPEAKDLVVTVEKRTISYLSGHRREANNIVPYCLSPDQSD